MSSTDQANSAARQDWNGALGEIWARQQALFDRVLAPAGEAAIDRANIQSGDKVIDVGCGCGATTAAIAELVGPTGEVFAVDISEPMLAEAKKRIGSDPRISFAIADAAIHPFPVSYYDVLFSRFGVMFFDFPAVAFANMRRALKPGGRLSFACFREAAKNTYVMLPLAAAYKHVPPLPSPALNAPGMFSFADDNRVRGILGAAGFNAIRLEQIDAKLDMAWALEWTPLSLLPWSWVRSAGPCRVRLPSNIPLYRSLSERRFQLTKRAIACFSMRHGGW